MRTPDSRTAGAFRTGAANGLVFIFAALLFWLGCGSPAPGQPEGSTDSAGGGLEHPLAFEKWTGDLDGMVERRLIRVLTTFNPFGYYIDADGTEKGATYEVMKMFEEKLNEQFKTGRLKVHVVMIPTSRDNLLRFLNEGRGDIASANLTITPERQEIVDFADPWGIDVREVVVTREGAPALNSAEDLSGMTATAVKESSYYTSLLKLNETLKAAGKAPVDIQVARPQLEVEDLAEMLKEGLLDGALIIDQHKAEPLAKAMGGLTVHTNAVLRSGGQIASAMRKNSPQLAAALNDFVKDHKRGTLMGNIIVNRYLKDTKRLQNALDEEGRARFAALRGIFEQYGGQYDLNWLAMIAQGYQESRLDQSVRSRAGAIGVMQLLQSTAEDPAVGLPNIEDEETNIHAGIKYMRYIADTYFNDPELDEWNQAFFSLAAYNAGPNRIKRIRAKAADQGVDPNIWFGNVEALVAKEVGMEPVNYVSNIFKYFAAYSLYMETRQQRENAKG